MKRQQLEDGHTHSPASPPHSQVTTCALSDARAKKPRVDDDTHQGRIRSFPHVQGNWPTHVFIAYAPDDCILEALHAVHERISSALQTPSDALSASSSSSSSSSSSWERIPSAELHVSLSHTFPLTLAQIDPFVDRLKARLAQAPSVPSSFQMELAGIQFLVNNERTRTFAAACVSLGHAVLQAIARAVDAALEEFGLPPFHANPSFHLTFAWCVGDVLPVVSRQIAGASIVLPEQAVPAPTAAIAALCSYDSGESSGDDDDDDDDSDVNTNPRSIASTARPAPVAQAQLDAVIRRIPASSKTVTVTAVTVKSGNKLIAVPLLKSGKRA